MSALGFILLAVIIWLFGWNLIGVTDNRTTSIVTGAAALLMVSYYIGDPLLAMLAMGLASFFNDMTLPGSWASCMDIGGKYAGTVSGCMNMMGNFGGMAGPVAVGYILDLTHRDWQIAFVLSTAVYCLGALCWLFIDPVTPLEQKSARR